jgi:hypothetical protein
MRDEIDRDVGTPGTLGHCVGVLVDGRLVERVDLRGLGLSSRRADLSERPTSRQGRRRVIHRTRFI